MPRAARRKKKDVDEAPPPDDDEKEEEAPNNNVSHNDDDGSSSSSDAAAAAAEPPSKKKKKAAPATTKKKAVTPLSSIPRSEVTRRPRDAGVFKVLSVNVAGLRSTVDPAKGKVDAFTKVVADEDPDLLLLNEHKLQEKDVDDVCERLAELLPQYGHRHFCCSTAKKGYSGVAALAKADVAVTEETFEGNPFPDEGRFLRIDLGRLALVATYVPNSGQDLGRLDDRTQRWDRALEAYVKNQDAPVVVIGDLNVARRPCDIHNMYARPNFDEIRHATPSRNADDLDPQYVGLTSIKKQAGLTAKERASFAAFLEDAEITDTFAAFHPEALGCFSYYSQRAVQNRPNNKGLRLDYVLASNDLLLLEDDDPPKKKRQVPAILDSFILDKDPAFSDHVPVGCLLQLE
eukprot:CAMPEP_0118902812 /NCGR_PEP_ID=MMETSP1166-20130328/7935_1 /TAXON_ID=1104430 /ORGANISM="Chrysoreinhardia sp, Strain CCMP3193" /LENGTH=402 /DNA_ID=CAMNT_0006842027 /DNA_START=154 /DNA_END=1362 /DNA_ORIENTATION=+